MKLSESEIATRLQQDGFQTSVVDSVCQYLQSKGGQIGYVDEAGSPAVFLLDQRRFGYDRDLEEGYVVLGADGIGDWFAVKEETGEVGVLFHETNGFAPFLEGEVDDIPLSEYEVLVSIVEESSSTSGLRSRLRDSTLRQDDISDEEILEIAAMVGNSAVVREFLASGFPAGKALIIAAKNNHLEVVRILVDHGVDLFVNDGNWGDLLKTPRLLGYSDVVELIEAARKRASGEAPGF